LSRESSNMGSPRDESKIRILRRLTLELSCPWRQVPMPARSNIYLGAARAWAPAGAGQLERIRRDFPSSQEGGLS
jgi:hypothetical protein